MADLGTSTHNRNPGGNKEPISSLSYVTILCLLNTIAIYGCSVAAGVGNPTLVEALQRYHREKLDNNEIISQRLKADSGMSSGDKLIRQF